MDSLASYSVKKRCNSKFLPCSSISLRLFFFFFKPPYGCIFFFLLTHFLLCEELHRSVKQIWTLHSCMKSEMPEWKKWIKQIISYHTSNNLKHRGLKRNNFIWRNQKKKKKRKVYIHDLLPINNNFFFLKRISDHFKTVKECLYLKAWPLVDCLSIMTRIYSTSNSNEWYWFISSSVHSPPFAGTICKRKKYVRTLCLLPHAGCSVVKGK